MENQAQDQNKSKAATHPQPTDEVQLTIETVTPDTHQSIPETPIDGHDTEEKVAKANDNEENDAKGSPQSEEVVPKEDDENEEGEEGAANDDQQQVNNDGEEDERDKIETIAP